MLKDKYNFFFLKVNYMTKESKKNISKENKNWVSKTKEGGLTSVVQNYFDKGVWTSSMPSTNADFIAVSFACSNDPQSPYSHTVWGPLELVVSEHSWRK